MSVFKWMVTVQYDETQILPSQIQKGIEDVFEGNPEITSVEVKPRSVCCDSPIDSEDCCENCGEHV